MFKINKDKSMEIVRGDTGTFEFTVEERNEEGILVPYTLVSGDLLIFTVKKTTKEKEIIIQKIGVGVSESTVIFTVEPEDTEELKYGKYYYDIEFNRNDGYVDTLIEPSLFIIKEEVTF